MKECIMGNNTDWFKTDLIDGNTATYAGHPGPVHPPQPPEDDDE